MTSRDIRDGLYAGKSIDLTALYPTNDQGGYDFRPDGLRVYFCGGFDAKVHEFKLQRPRDLRNAQLVASHSVAALAGLYISGIRFKPDGLQAFFLVHHTSPPGGIYYRKLIQIPLTEAWEPGTLGAIVAASEELNGGSLISLDMHPEGTRAYVTDGDTRRLHAYDLDAWDAGTLTDPNESLLLTSDGEVNAGTARFSSDGSRIYATGLQQYVYEHAVPTPWVLTGGGYTGRRVFTREFGARAPEFSPDGRALFVLTNSPGALSQYTFDRSLFFRQLQHLLPRALAWRTTVTKGLRRFLFGLTAAPEDARDFVDDVHQDAFPATTRELSEYETQFALTGIGDEETRRQDLDAAWKATGGQSPSYLQGVLHNAGFTTCFIHEWWSSGPDPYVTRDPRVYTHIPLSGTVQCGEALALCGEPNALCDNFLINDPGYLVNEDLTHRPPPPIPNDPEYWPYFMYICAETFGVPAVVTADRLSELKRILLKYRPTHLWIVLMTAETDPGEVGIFNFEQDDGWNLTVWETYE